MKNINTCYMPEANLLKIYLQYGNDYNYSEIIKAIYDHRGCSITIADVFSTDALNSVCNILSVLDYDNDITIDLTYSDNMEDIQNGDYIQLDTLPSNIKIKGFPKDNLQSEFTTWAHNLDPAGKNNVLNVLTKEDKLIFLKQSNVIQKFKKEFIHYLTISKKLPEETEKTAFAYLNSLSERERFELIFDYIRSHFVCISDESSKKYDDVVKIFEEGTGSSKGLAHLLTLLSNNYFFNLNCTPVSGVTSNGIPHTWNLFVDSKNNIYQYDLQHNIKERPFSETCNRTITNYYSCIASIGENFGNPSKSEKEGSYKPVVPFSLRKTNKDKKDKQD